MCLWNSSSGQVGCYADILGCMSTVQIVGHNKPWLPMFGVGGKEDRDRAGILEGRRCPFCFQVSTSPLHGTKFQKLVLLNLLEGPSTQYLIGLWSPKPSGMFLTRNLKFCLFGASGSVSGRSSVSRRPSWNRFNSSSRPEPWSSGSQNK